MFGHLTANTLWGVAGLGGLLVSATAVTGVLKLTWPQTVGREVILRLRSWWIMAGILAAALLLSRTTMLVFLAFVSFLALKEFLSLVPTRRADRRVLFWGYLSIPVQYYWVGIEWYGMFTIFIPVYVFLLLPMRMVLIGETAGFLRAVGTVHWGLMTTVFSLSHTAYLLVLPLAQNPAAGGAGLLLYLLFLTQFNDVAQYVWGRLFGRQPVVPTVSPKKTWGGLLGGVATTMLLATALSGWLTPLSTVHALVAGLIIGLGGFIGDVTVSALKRDIGIKDSGSLIPGHGGILDRVDSLTYTAPLFFHYVHYLHY